MDMKLELVMVPVTDVERAKKFYVDQAGFEVLVDHQPNDEFRVVQLTPPGSGCSIVFGNGIQQAEPGSSQGLHLVVADIEAACSELTERAVEVDGPFHFSTTGRTDGVDPQRNDYGSFAAFSDPDGNSWVVQEINGRDGWKLEIVVVPVADVDRSKVFYTDGLGWVASTDHHPNDQFRVVQVDPPGSPCSVTFGKGVSEAAPGSVRGIHLVVEDLEAARAELSGRGVTVGDPFHFAVTGERSPGVDPARTNYSSFAEFSDPDANTYLLQEVRREGLGG